MKHLYLSLRGLALGAALSALAASPALAAPAAKAAPPGFKDYDSNADGLVDKREFRALGGHEQAFLEGDVNRDNRLSSGEFVKASANNDRGTAGKDADDAWITAKVMALLLKDEAVKPTDLEVRTHEGMVLLSGKVSNTGQIAKAEEIARGVQGVKMVSNDLRVKR